MPPPSLAPGNPESMELLGILGVEMVLDKPALDSPTAPGKAITDKQSW